MSRINRRMSWITPWSNFALFLGGEPIQPPRPKQLAVSDVGSAIEFVGKLIWEYAQHGRELIG